MQPKSGERKGTGGAELSFDGEWTGAMSEALLGEKAVVKSIVFPAGITAIGEEALRWFIALEWVVFPESCTAFSVHALANCKSLRAISLPTGYKAIERGTFRGFGGLASVTIPIG
jgi:hypothetical protein